MANATDSISKVVTVQKYLTTNGYLFETKAEAEKYQRLLDIHNLLDWNCEGVRGSQIDSFVESMIKNKHKLIQLLLKA